LDLQHFSKGIEKNMKSTTDGQEIIGRVNRAENTLAQKNKDTQRDKGMQNHEPTETGMYLKISNFIRTCFIFN